MNNLFTVLILIIPLICSAQDEEYIFDYLRNNVKCIEMSKLEKKEIIYKEGIILTKENYPANLERSYHYSKIGKLDSIIFREITKDTIYLSKQKYKYQSDKLTNIEYGWDIENEIIRIDSLSYNAQNLVDTVFWYSNRVEGAFRTMRIDSLRLYAHFTYEYDKELKLVKEKINEPFGLREKHYFYNESNNIEKIKEYYGKVGYGIVVGEEEKYSVSILNYSDNGLL